MAAPLGLGILALFGLLASSKRSGATASTVSPVAPTPVKPVIGPITPKVPTPAIDVQSEVERIEREAKEIVDGNRDAFSESDDAVNIITTPPDDGVDAAIKAAVEAADRERDAQPLPAPVAPSVDDASDDADLTPNPTAEPAQVQDDLRAIETAPVVAPTPEPSPRPSPSLTPPGYDPDGARRMAQALARNIKNKGRSGYDRRLVKTFQTKAGIVSDGIYGGETAGALMFYAGSEAPKPLFPPLEVIPYRQPT